MAHAPVAQAMVAGGHGVYLFVGGGTEMESYSEGMGCAMMLAPGLKIEKHNAGGVALLILVIYYYC